MGPAVPQLRPVLLALFGLYLLVYPGSTVVVALDRVPHWGAWMGGALLIVQGALMGLWLVANDGRRGALAAAIIVLGSWAVEHLGVTTGFPFGGYDYTAALQPTIGGVVPLAIPFAWLLVVPAAVGMAGQLLAGRGGAVAQTLVAASLALLLDVTIEPVAVHVNGYWVWRDEGFYYGVPASNFAAWWFTSLLLVGTQLWLRGPRRAAASRALLPLLPAALYALNLAMFVIVNLAHSQTLAAAIGLVLLGWLLAATGAARRAYAALTSQSARDIIRLRIRPEE
jgi:putative membrane protein